MKKEWVIFLLFMFFLASVYAQIDNSAYILKGKTFAEALEESTEQWNDIFFDDSVTSPIVVIASAQEELPQPDTDSRNEVRKQKFTILENISGSTETECIFTYSVLPSHGERIIAENEQIIGVLKKYKKSGEYMLLTAISYSEENKTKVIKEIELFNP